MTYEKFIVTVNEYHKHHPQCRYGQCVMNVLHSYRPDLYDLVLNDQLDCFYTTDLASVLQTLQWIERQFARN